MVNIALQASNVWKRLVIDYRLCILISMRNINLGLYYPNKTSNVSISIHEGSLLSSLWRKVVIFSLHLCVVSFTYFLWIFEVLPPEFNVVFLEEPNILLGHWEACLYWAISLEISSKAQDISSIEPRYFSRFYVYFLSMSFIPFMHNFSCLPMFLSFFVFLSYFFFNSLHDLISFWTLVPYYVRKSLQFFIREWDGITITYIKLITS